MKRSTRIAGLTAALAATALVAGCQRGPQTAATAQAPTAEADKTMTQQDPRFTLEEQAWREQRRESLLKPDGWTSLIGLHWVDQARISSAAAATTASASRWGRSISA